MEIEVNSWDQATKKVLMEKVNLYKKSLQSVDKDYENAKSKALKSDLIGQKSLEQRQRLASANDRYHFIILSIIYYIIIILLLYILVFF